jgi:hypothetical protein
VASKAGGRRKHSPQIGAEVVIGRAQTGQQGPASLGKSVSQPAHRCAPAAAPQSRQLRGSSASSKDEIDKRKAIADDRAMNLQSDFSRAAASYDNAAVLAREVGRRMAARLDYVRIDPRRLADIGCATGDGVRELMRRYPAAAPLAIDYVPAGGSACADVLRAASMPTCGHCRWPAAVWIWRGRT